mmetsp:Transcript_39819/g.158354  ORF Transcript_39819/g.158354 Transcript_39819/m.158354 type:complete len:80 (-) Transcript_39819:790-1029(-)
MSVVCPQAPELVALLETSSRSPGFARRSFHGGNTPYKKRDGMLPFQNAQFAWLKERTWYSFYFVVLLSDARKLVSSAIG